MRLLLDTHVLLWAVSEPNRLNAEIRALLEDAANDVLTSAAGIWEIAIKAMLGWADFAVRPAQIAQAARQAEFLELSVSADTAARVVDLPLHHRDPLIGSSWHKPWLSRPGFIRQIRFCHPIPSWCS